jgi:hypothetical protein
MTPPAGVATYLSLAAAASLLGPLVTLADETHDGPRQAIQRDLPRYDPAFREKDLAAKAERGAVAPRTAPAALPVENTARASGTTVAPADPAAVELPKVTVHPLYAPPKHLPRMDAPKPLRDLPAEPFESAAGRQARLIRKHLSPLQRALSRIPLIGAGIVGSAYEAEARELKATQMNSLAEGIEMQELLGRDPAEIKKLRAEYEKLYYSAPKH